MSTSGEDPGVMEVTGKVLITAIIALFVVLILVFLFHIYARWLWLRRRQQTIDNNNPNRPRQGQHSGVTVLRRGLDETFLKTLPITLHDSSKDFNDPLECSVCLSQVEQGENIRLLPKCNHAFHAECIDMWFHSHSTCPICRNSVSEQTQQLSVETLLENNTQEQQSTDGLDSHTSNFYTNVLFWGDETEVSTLTSQLEELDQANNNHQPASLDQPTTSSSSSSSSKPDLVIDIPSQMQGNQEEDEKTPVLSRMRSLRRILSRRFNPFSPPPAAAAANN